MVEQMSGHLAIPGSPMLRAGFMHPSLGRDSALAPSAPILNRGNIASRLPEEIRNSIGSLQRGEIVGDVNQVLMHLGMTLQEFERAITSTQTAFPVRENLESEAKLLIPVETPYRNMLPRVKGSGTAVNWRQVTSLGGGWGSGFDQGGGGSAIRSFFVESGAPADHATVYANKTASYKLLGTYGSVTGFAMAAGANFQNQLAVEKTNAIMNLMLNEEYALISGDSTSVAVPWGDGATAMSFDGIITLVATANGTPAAQVQTAVGALTLAHIDGQLRRLYNQGARGQFMLLNGQEILSLVHLAETSGSIIRVTAAASGSGAGQTVLGVHVTGYMHPITGEVVPIIPSRFVPAGTMIFGSKQLPDGNPTAEVEVLPQVELPELAPNEPVQGYVAQELAPTTAAPQVYPFIVSVYEVLKLKSALHYAKSSGVTAV